MFLRIGRKILNAGNLVDADVYEPGDDLAPHREGTAEGRVVVVITTTVEAGEDGAVGPRKLFFEGEDADLFLEALPVYAPVLEGERS